MADSSRSDTSADTTDEKETPSGALRHIVIGFLVFAAATGVYVWRARSSNAALMLVREAKNGVAKGDVPSLRIAEQKLMDALAEQSGNDSAEAGLALVEAML